ncbi:MAG: YifB family Mg chelatase-like AAA ATPase, partial [Arenicella sp.]
DLHVHLSRMNISDLQSLPKSETSVVIAKRVSRAQQVQMRRQNGLNAQLNSEQVDLFCRIDSETKELLIAAEKRLNLSARGYTRVLKLARTIADLKGNEWIDKSDAMEALAYRQQF